MDWSCPRDRHTLEQLEGQLVCPHCRQGYPVRDRIPLFDGKVRGSAGASQPALGELWQLIEAHTPDRAAELFCETHRCSRYRSTVGWEFFAPLDPKGRVLEIGAGFGDDTIELCSRTARTISLVPNLDNGRILQRRLEAGGCSSAAIAVQGDLAALPLASGSISTIVMEDVAAASFNLSGAAWASAAAEWHRVLEPGGAVFLGSRNPIYRWPGLRQLQSLVSREDPCGSLNRLIKKAAGPRRSVGLGRGRASRLLSGAGFEPTAAYAPLPDEHRIEIVLPLDDVIVQHYFFSELLRKNSALIRAGIRLAHISIRLGLFKRLVPYYFLLFTLPRDTPCSTTRGPTPRGPRH